MSLNTRFEIRTKNKRSLIYKEKRDLKRNYICITISLTIKSKTVES